MWTRWRIPPQAVFYKKSNGNGIRNNQVTIVNNIPKPPFRMLQKVGTIVDEPQMISLAGSQCSLHQRRIFHQGMNLWYPAPVFRKFFGNIQLIKVAVGDDTRAELFNHLHQVIEVGIQLFASRFRQCDSKIDHFVKHSVFRQDIQHEIDHPTGKIASGRKNGFPVRKA